MLGDIPAVPIALYVGLVVILPSALIAFLWGGRGLVVALGLLTASAIAYLVWFFGFRSREDWTGMEGIALVVFPIMLLATAVTALLCYAVLTLLQLLPDQRRRPRGDKPPS